MQGAPPPPSKGDFSGSNPMHARAASAPQAVTASRALSNNNSSSDGSQKKRRMSSREVIAAAASGSQGAHPPRRKSTKKPPPPRPAGGSKTSSKGPAPRQVEVLDMAGMIQRQIDREAAASRQKRAASLPKHPELKRKVSQDEAQRSYRRGSLVDRYRRASVFNEIIAEQQREAMEKAASGGGHHSRKHTRVDMIQGTARVGVDTQHRSRLMAFEQVAHSGHEDEYVINPYCVAAMPEPIRKAFVTKVLGIVAFQILLMVAIICIIKYTGLGQAILEGYTMWSLLTTFIPLIILAVLFGVRKNHPWNLIVFSLFTASWAYSLGVACVWLNNRLFISVMGCTAFNTACIMVFAHCVSYDNFNCCSCSLVITLMSIVTMFISYGIYPDEPWGNHIWPAIVFILFGSWICWDIKALQIDLTADEYIIGAVDLYLDILNMFLWLLICCLHCFETVLKG